MTVTDASVSPKLSKSPDTPVVYVVDGDPSIRAELDALIRSAGWSPRTAASAEEFLARPRIVGPGCLLVELKLKGISGLDLQRLVHNRAELPLIFMSSHIDVAATVQAMKGGALEFLAKPLSREALVEAISQAMERSHAALSQLAQVSALQRRFESLSRREKDVMGLLVTGRLNKLVAAELGISVVTVKAHKGKIMRKMKARSLLELVTMVGKLRLGVGTPATNA